MRLSASAIVAAYSCYLCVRRILESVVCISSDVCASGTSAHECVFRVGCCGYEALLPRLCGGSCPGSGMLMDGMGCQSLGSLLASGTEVALLNTALPRLSPNTTAHFKVSCLCGAVSSPPQGTRLLPFVWNLYRSLPTGVFLNVGVGWLLPCLVQTRRGVRTHTHTSST